MKMAKQSRNGKEREGEMKTVKLYDHVGAHRKDGVSETSHATAPKARAELLGVMEIEQAIAAAELDLADLREIGAFIGRLIQNQGAVATRRCS